MVTTRSALDPRVWRMAFARAINTMGLSQVMSFLGIYVVETRGYPAWVYGLIALAANLGQSMSNAWAGNLSDRIGRRPLITYALVADVVPESQRVSAFGIQRMGTNVGWAVGPALGGVLTLVIPYGAVFYIAAAGMIVAGIVTLRIADPVRRTVHAASPDD